ncbi:MAG: 3-phosphoserine/phosphohydroxythreonine transaminase [Gammaproteobacteria bacterium]|nr:3-phosphoserine/phosphohydroxythreonine transaminase [Gammaproteobacteria bacterium]
MNHPGTVNRVFNFSAGPSTLPLEVLSEVQQEFVDYRWFGHVPGGDEPSRQSFHGGARGGQGPGAAGGRLRRRVRDPVPAGRGDAAVLDGADELPAEGAGAGYVDSGSWAKGAIADAKCYGDVYVAWDGQAHGYTRMPSSDEIAIRGGTRYLHITSNETIGGIRYPEWPDVSAPLVADVSSEYMAVPIPWDRVDLVYGGVQKNLGPAGLAVVYIRKSVVAGLNRALGRYLRYDVHVDKDSMFNTPPVFAVYMLGKVLKWIEANGGLEAMEEAAARKAGLLYEVIDGSGGYYRSPVDKACRSHMNVVFRLPDEALEARFLKEAAARGMVNLKGHRSVGGVRASLYNAMPEAGVRALAEFMAAFRADNPA